MTDHEKIYIPGKIVFDDNNEDKRSWFFWDTPLPDLRWSFCSGLSVILLIKFGDFWKIHQSKTCNEAFVWAEKLFSAAVYILLSPKLWTIQIATKNCVFILLVCPSQTRKSDISYNWLKNGTFPTKFHKTYFFCQHSQPLYDVLQKAIDDLEFVQGVKFENLDLFKNLGERTC